MRLPALAALLCFLCGASLAQQPSDSKKTDLEQLQGIWDIVGLESGGKAQPAANYKGNSFYFSKEKARLRESGFSQIEFTLALDPTKSPKTIELTARGNAIHGIYKLDGDDLILTVSLGGMRPPLEFATKVGGDSETFILKRSQWQRYSDKTHGFAIDFPTKHTESKREDSIPSGKATTTIFTSHDDAEKLTFALSVTPIPMPFGMREGDAALDAALKSLVAELEKTGKVKTEQEGKFKQPGGVGPAREFTISWERSNAREKSLIRARLYVVADRVFALTAMGNEEIIKSPNVMRFWNSFVPPLPLKKEPPPKP